MWESSGGRGQPHGMLSVLLGAQRGSPAMGAGAIRVVLSILQDPPPADLLGTGEVDRERDGKVLDGFSITRATAFIFVVVRSLFSDGTLTED